jgi:2-dehydro-3-deoxyphosphogluconate aldolase/(4S)-4-hydroxy-2-oxoglutarate aldolase
MNRQAIVARIETTGIVPIIRSSSTDLAARAAHAVLASGIDIVEITMNVPDALPLLRRLRGQIGPDVLLGAGTVLDADTARACIEAGAQFIVAPGLDVETIRAAHSLDRPCLPGALSPTEVITAWRAGADMVKVFPCSAVGGADYVRSLRGPLPDVKILATGGVNLDTAADFIAAGATVLGVGAGVIDLKLLEPAGAAAVTERFVRFMEIVQSARRMGCRPLPPRVGATHS